MKKNYLFARNLGRFSREDVLYIVSVGSSQREQVKFDLVQEYCKDCGIYFQPVSDRTDTVIRNLASSLFSGCLWPSLMVRKATVSITQLYDMIIDDSFIAFEMSHHPQRHFFHLMHHIDPHFLHHFPISKSNTLLPTQRRKNLKSSERESIGQAIIGFCLILLTFVVAGYICGTESWY